MSSKTIDKENSAGLFISQKGLGLGKSLACNNINGVGIKNEKLISQNVNINSKTNSTPVICMDKKSQEITNTASKQRRALGDVLNTTNRQKSIGLGLGVTPKVSRTLNVDCTPLGLQSSLRGNSSKNKLSEMQQFDKQPLNGTSLKKDVTEEEELPPVERFIGSKYDSFNDLFDDGKLSELFLSSNSSFYSNLNQRGSSHSHDLDNERLNVVPVDEDDVLERELKRMKKSLKKMGKKEMIVCQELPSLDDLMPKIYEDDDDGHFFD